ncbi:SusD family protein [Bacteroidales bacterium Barb7]|nr:SusD family protein [Bacteroidales bacterium Barb7]
MGGRYEASLNDAIIELLQDPNTGGNRAEIIQISDKSKQVYNGIYWRAQQDNPEYVFRIAEQYLIRAEARAHLNDLSGSLEDLNRVRARADVLSLAANTYNTPEKALQAIENERRVEFAVENHRFFDLRRTNRLSAVLGETEGYLFPIPINELNKDNALEPNPSN